MKSIQSILKICLLLTLFISCSKSNQQEARRIPILREVPLTFFDFKTEPSIVQKVHLINSEEELLALFSENSIPLPEATVDFKTESLLVLIDVSLDKDFRVKNSFVYYEKEKTYLYLVHEYSGEKTAKEEEVTAYFYYTGIIIEKIPDDSAISVSFAITGETA